MIQRAAKDPNIERIVLLPDDLRGAGMASLMEIGQALERFRSSGKEVVAVSDGMTQLPYLLSTHADQILLHPDGAVLLNGFASYRGYYKDLLDKLAVTVHLFRVGEFKSAAEPYILNGASSEAREADRYWLDGLWQTWLSEVGSRRKLEPKAIQNGIEILPDAVEDANGDMAKIALTSHLVDRLATRDEAREILIAKGVADKDIAFLLWTWYQPSGESLVEHLHLLLKDGSGYQRLDLPPDELDMAGARRFQPERVIQWRRQGSDWQIRDHDDKDWRTVQGRPAQPAEAGQRVDGTFTHSWYSILGGSSSQNRFHFHGDGQFEQSGRAVFGTGSMAAAAGVTGMATTSYSRGGSTGTSSVSAVGAGAGGGTTQRRNGADFTGRYRLERWAMVVERDNGEQQRVLFAFSGPERRSVFIKDTGYSK